MKPATGRWVSGADFFDRETELGILETRVREGNHTLLTGQRRMGKTSIARELGRRLAGDGWTTLFADVEDAACAEDAIAELARAAHSVRSILARVTAGLRGVRGSVEEVGVLDFRVKFRACLDAGNWRRHGDGLIRACAEHERPVLLVIDELPILLTRMLREEAGARRVDEFLSWLRRALQGLEGDSPVVVLSGSVGLMPLVTRLCIPDRVNYLDPFRLGPWSRDASIACFERLSARCGLQLEDGVAEAAYDALGIGIPHHVQSFFARLREAAAMQGRDRVTTAEVGEVYRTELLGPSGQSDLLHYETRLADALDDESRRIAMEILAEAAVQGVFGADARRALERIYAPLVRDAPARVAEALDVLEHDGYLEPGADGYRFPSRLLKDWWAARFHDHHVPLADRGAAR